MALFVENDKMQTEKANCCIAKEIIKINKIGITSDSNQNQLNGLKERNDYQNELKLKKALNDFLQRDGRKVLSSIYSGLSSRDKRKLIRKLGLEGKKNGSVYNGNGAKKTTARDYCDCLNETCPGCHFPCPKCKSTKCGHECRVNRKWMYESIENEGDKVIIKNNLLNY